MRRKKRLEVRIFAAETHQFSLGNKHGPSSSLRSTCQRLPPLTSSWCVTCSAPQFAGAARSWDPQRSPATPTGHWRPNPAQTGRHAHAQAHTHAHARTLLPGHQPFTSAPWQQAAASLLHTPSPPQPPPYPPQPQTHQCRLSPSAPSQDSCVPRPPLHPLLPRVLLYVRGLPPAPAPVISDVLLLISSLHLFLLFIINGIIFPSFVHEGKFCVKIN